MFTKRKNRELTNKGLMKEYVRNDFDRNLDLKTDD